MKTDLLTKDDIARELSPPPDEPLSTRSVERYIQLAGITPAVKGSGRGKQAKFRRADVDKIKAAYTAAQEQRKESTALTTTKPAAISNVALVEELTNKQAEGFQSLRAALDVWPVWLTRAEALERTGLPPTWFDAGARSGTLPHSGTGRARRFHRDDVRTFAERVRDKEYLLGILGESPQSET
jgi:hypothetical protein